MLRSQLRKTRETVCWRQPYTFMDRINAEEVNMSPEGGRGAEERSMRKMEGVCGRSWRAAQILQGTFQHVQCPKKSLLTPLALLARWHFLQLPCRPIVFETKPQINVPNLNQHICLCKKLSAVSDEHWPKFTHSVFVCFLRRLQCHIRTGRS